MPSTLNMKCNSYFQKKFGRSIPEVDGYKYVSFDDKHLFLTKSRVGVIDKVKVTIKKMGYK